MDQLSLGVMARSRKENERRLAIHPLHVERIETGLRRRIYLERGYGERFGVPDERLAGFVAGMRTRDQLLADCDVLLLLKPLPRDLEELGEGQVLWGWPHCVQNEEITGMCPFVKQAGPAARLHGDRLLGARQARDQPDHPAALPGQPGLFEAMARPPWRLRAPTRRRPSCFMARTRSTSPIAGQR